MKIHRRPDLNLPFCSAVESRGLLFLSGMGPLDRITLKYVPGTIEDETKRTLQTLDEILQKVGCTRESVIRCTCYLADLKNFPGFTKAFGEFFDGHTPARTTVGAPLLADIKVEIDVIAELPE